MSSFEKFLVVATAFVLRIAAAMFFYCFLFVATAFWLVLLLLYHDDAVATAFWLLLLLSYLYVVQELSGIGVVDCYVCLVICISCQHRGFVDRPKICQAKKWQISSISEDDSAVLVADDNSSIIRCT